MLGMQRDRLRLCWKAQWDYFEISSCSLCKDPLSERTELFQDLALVAALPNNAASLPLYYLPWPKVHCALVRRALKKSNRSLVARGPKVQGT